MLKTQVTKQDLVEAGSRHNCHFVLLIPSLSICPDSTALELTSTWQTEERKLISVSPEFLLLAHKRPVRSPPPGWHLCTGPVPALLCSATASSKTGNGSGTAKCSAEHWQHAPRSLILPYCIYATSLKANNTPNSFAALQVSRKPPPAPSRSPSPLEHWHLSTTQHGPPLLRYSRATCTSKTNTQLCFPE